MKKFNRVLAMLLALVTVLAVLPISALAEDWLRVETDKTTVENVASTDITVSVDPKVLLSYMKDGDIKGLLKGISASGSLGDILTKEEILAIIPEEEIISLVKAIIADIDVKELINCFDADKLLACVDKDGLISLLKGMDLKSYVKDVDILMNYVDKGDIEKAIDYVDTDALIDDYSAELMDLALDLAPETLFNVVDLDKAVKLKGIDVEAAANISYIQTVIGYATLADKYVDNAKLDAFVDANLTRFSASIPAYVNTAKLSVLFDDVKDKLADYMDAEKAEAIVKDAYYAGAFDGVDVTAYIDGANIDVEAMIADGILADLYDELLNGDATHPAAFDVKVLLFGNATLDPLFPDLAALVKANVVDVEELLNKKVITIDELIANKVVDVDALAAQYGYANLVKTDVIKAQVTTAINGGVITSADVVACLKDYDAAIDAIGVEEAVAAVGGYMAVIDYVTDFEALVNTFDVIAIAKGILRDRVIDDIVDINGLVRAIDVRAFVSKVNIKQLIKVVYESGVAQTLLDQLDLQSYLIRVFGIYNSIATTVTEIKLNGAVVASPNKSTDVLQLNAAGLLDALENLVPSLNELANIGDDGKIFGVSFAFSYYESEADDAEILTKEINVDFVLESGVDLIRRAAAKLALLIDKIGYIGIDDGKLVADINVPTEFATVLRVALEKMADSSNPAVNAIKDKVLAVYTQQPDDFIAFAEGLTLEEIVAVLEAVDPALFGKAYNKVLTSRYAKVLLSYIERVTGYDFSDNLEAQNLVNTLANIPTFEYFVEKLEAVTGKEITDRLPAKINGYFDHTVYDVIDKLAEVAGYDFDLQNLLKNAAASPDPFAYLYTAVVNKIENADAAYSFVKRNAIRVANRLLASRVGAVVADNCLMDFYAGNSAFVFEKVVTFDAKVVLEKGLKKVLGAVAARVSAIENRKETITEGIETVLDMVLGDSAYITTGFDITVNVRNIYRATFVDENNNVIIKTFLPVGTNLSKMVDNYNGNADFEGWLNVATDAIIDYMPAGDVVLKATLKSDETTTEEPEVTTPEETTTEDPEVTEPEETTPDEPQPEEPEVSIGDLVYGEDYTVDADAQEGYAVILDSEHWNSELRFELPVALLNQLILDSKNLVLTADATLHKVVMNIAMMNQLVGDADAENSDVVGFNYKPDAELYFNYNKTLSGAVAYDFAFDFGAAPEVGYVFDTNASVVITLPFTGIAAGTEGAMTFVYADGVEVAESAATAESVTFTATHFSNYTIVNKYLLTIENDGFYVGNNKIQSVIATVTAAGNVQLGGEYYEAGAIISANLQVGTVSGYTYLKTAFEGSTYELTAAGNFDFTMPANAVTVKHYAEEIEKYVVYYYINGALVGEYEYAADADTNTVVAAILGFDLTAYPAVVGDGWDWMLFNGTGFVSASTALAAQLRGEPIKLFRVHNEQTEITFKFTGVDSVTAVYKISELNQNVFADLNSTINAAKPRYEWSTALTGKTLTYYVENADYEALIEAALANNGIVEFAGTRANQNYHIYTDGNVTVEELPVGMKATAAAKEGFNAKIQIFNHSTGALVAEFNNYEGNFTLTHDVYICVVYTAETVNYKEVTITVPAGSLLTTDPLTLANAEQVDLVLVKAERGTDGSLKLTYRYTMVEGFDATAFEASINALVSNNAEYATTWIVNGVAYDSELAASQAALPEGAKIVGWTDMSENVKLAIIEYTAPAGVSAWLIVCIILAVLLLIAVIVLIYVLHVTDKIAASWLTKVCAAIVGAFFAFCMMLAKFTLKVLNFMGIKTEDVIEELPEEEPVEDIPAVIIDTEEATEEAAEEAVEEATEEVVEEATEEVVEEAAEEAVEEAAEEAVEEATEEVVEEATEEAVEEATEEVVEEATEEVVEEATEEVVEEATEEVVEEATEEVSEEEKKDE